MLLSDLLTRAAERSPDKTSVICAGEALSFGELARQGSQVATRLRRLGIGHGSRVAILHENSLSAVVFFWGVLLSGAYVVDVPCLAGIETIYDILKESEPAALVASQRQLQRLSARRSAAPVPIILAEHSGDGSTWNQNIHTLAEITSTEPVEIERPCGHECEVSLIIYTSGTTGKPKGVMLSHRNLVSNIHAVNQLMRLDSTDSILVVVPLHFIHGRMQLLTHALVGGTLVLSSGFQYPQQTVDDLGRYSVTGFSGVPYHFSMLLDRTSLATTRLPHLRYVVITGGALAPTPLRKLSEALPGVAIHIGYGQTETSPRISNLSPAELFTRPGSCGLPIPGVRIDIVSEDGTDVGPGAIGEVVVSGPNVMCGYVSGDERVSEKLDALGRLRTGDLGKLDADGYLYLVGRKSELIKSAGERVFPREIELVLETHPSIAECAVLGIPDELFGERIAACVVPRAGTALDIEQLRTFCLQSLPLVRIPREIRVSDGLPKTASGKTDRATLLRHFSQIPVLARSHVA